MAVLPAKYLIDVDKLKELTALIFCELAMKEFEVFPGCELELCPLSVTYIYGRIVAETFNEV